MLATVLLCPFAYQFVDRDPDNVHMLLPYIQCGYVNRGQTRGNTLAPSFHWVFMGLDYVLGLIWNGTMVHPCT